MKAGNLKAFDLFSGGGGFHQSAEKAGVSISAFCEIDKYAVKFYNQAFNTEKELYFNDATKINTRELPDFDILLAGFPCQAFSIAGKRQGFNDTRGTLFFDVARILHDKRPKYFVLENVKGLLNHDNGKTFQTILRILSNIGIYSIEWALLNSKFFGVPQNRERTYIVGYPRKYGIGKIFPLGKTSKVYNEAGENKEEIHNIASTLKARDYANWGGNFIYQLPRGNNKGGLKEICPTISIAFDNASQQRIRRLTPLECFRLQGYSDEVFYKGSKGIPDTQLYKIAGNSVTVKVVYEIIKKIVEIDKEQV